MTRRPRRSTLFPYTTLFRSWCDSTRCSRVTGAPDRRTWFTRPPARTRSEEHTSELQSLRHLVCRLLLEKKKKKQVLCCYQDVTAYGVLHRTHRPTGRCRTLR